MGQTRTHLLAQGMIQKLARGLRPRIQQTFSEGGRVNMNKPRVTPGLTNLLNKYSTGPLAGAGNVSRGTPVQPFNQGGAAQTYEEALKDPNRMNLAKRLGPVYEAWASSGIGNTPSQPLVNSLEYRNYGSNKNVPQGDFNPYSYSHLHAGRVISTSG